MTWFNNSVAEGRFDELVSGMVEQCCHGSAACDTVIAARPGALRAGDVLWV